MCEFTLHVDENSAQYWRWIAQNTFTYPTPKWTSLFDCFLALSPSLSLAPLSLHSLFLLYRTNPFTEISFRNSSAHPVKISGCFSSQPLFLSASCQQILLFLSFFFFQLPNSFLSISTSDKHSTRIQGRTYISFPILGANSWRNVHKICIWQTFKALQQFFFHFFLYKTFIVIYLFALCSEISLTLSPSLSLSRALNKTVWFTVYQSTIAWIAILNDAHFIDVSKTDSILKAVIEL